MNDPLRRFMRFFDAEWDNLPKTRKIERYGVTLLYGILVILLIAIILRYKLSGQ